MNPKERFQSHVRNSKKENSEEYNNPLYCGFRKHGIDNFTFEVIGFFENYNDMEKYYIALYNSTDIRFGYNILIGGEEPPIGMGGNLKYSDEVIEQINKDLLETNLTYEEIAIENHVSYSHVIQVNNGTRRPIEGVNYPIRNVTTFDFLEQRAILIIWDLENTNLNQKEIAKKHGVARSCVTMINIGKNHKQPNKDYPIRK